MKQKNTELQEENQALKQSLQELIEINNELTDSMEEFNYSGRLEEKNK
jgi:cell shape-determining protein MreC